MSNLVNSMAVLAGIAVRLIIPVLITVSVVYLLRKLDENWQAEGRKTPVKAQKPACWEVMGCAADKRKDCPGYTSKLPCWQARRMPNGYLCAECIGCKVFLKAPAVKIG